MAITVRKGMPDVHLTREAFTARFRERFYDPAFEQLQPELRRILDAAWEAYDEYRKSPRRKPAGPDCADPAYELPVEWLAAREAVREAEKRQKDPASPSRILIVNGSSRTNQSCPGEMSKTYRLALLAQEIVAGAGIEVDLLDLSVLTSEYGRHIHPCKACVSTAMPLCHWPCSCYPNHALGQVNDWMAELYPRWAAAHGVMILCPVNWYQAPSGLKLMIDRLVCADGGNPDPTTTKLKYPDLAKEIEMKGWHFPRHLAGRAFAVVVHGDADGVETLRRSLTDWLSSMGLIQAGHQAAVGAYIGYMEPYATSHEALDTDGGLLEEVRNAARALCEAVAMIRRGELKTPDRKLKEPRPK
jgi:multimeric flavodoxin WrbA